MFDVKHHIAILHVQKSSMKIVHVQESQTALIKVRDIWLTAFGLITIEKNKLSIFYLPTFSQDVCNEDM